MKTLTIEWKHLDKEGATCVRCSDTGKTLAEVVKDLSREWKGVESGSSSRKLC